MTSNIQNEITLQPVSNEEFERFIEESVGGLTDAHVIAEFDSSDDDYTYIHYTSKEDGMYLGSARILDNEVEFLLDEEVLN